MTGGARLVRSAQRPVAATIALPGSKSLTIRATVAAALAEGRSHLYGPLVAEDTMAMASALDAMGASIQRDTDPWAIDGTDGHLAYPEHLDAGESALSARLLIPLASLGSGEVTVSGRGSLLRRPMSGLLAALAELGVETRSEGHVPVVISGRNGFRGGPVVVDCSMTSQFATALLMTGPMAQDALDLRLEGLSGSAGYLEMTVAVMRTFGAVVEATITGYRVEPSGYRAADFLIEPDASAATYPMLAAAITGGRVELGGLRIDSAQPDMAVVGALEEMGCRVYATRSGIAIQGPDGGRLLSFAGDLSGSPDGAIAVAVAALFGDGPSRLEGLGSLRHKESDRIQSLTTEIERLGGIASVEGDALTVTPGSLGPGTVEPHGDHRIAMAFATVGLVVDGVRVADPTVVDKTWPGYWAMLDRLAG